MDNSVARYFPSIQNNMCLPTNITEFTRCATEATYEGKQDNTIIVHT
jgi:hypothetical protein